MAQNVVRTDVDKESENLLLQGWYLKIKIVKLSANCILYPMNKRKGRREWKMVAGYRVLQNLLLRDWKKK